MDFTKSLYCLAVQCPKSAWLSKYKSDVQKLSDAARSRMTIGKEIGTLAQGRFVDCVAVQSGAPDDMVRRTQILLEADTPVIAEASFKLKGLFCSVDILKNLGSGRVEIYEVKSSTTIKPIYLHDAAFQAYVLKSLGYSVERVCIEHINNQYILHGELDLKQLFESVDVTDEVSDIQQNVATNVERFAAYLAKPEEPGDEINEHCIHPETCAFWEYCSKHICTPSVFDLYRLGYKKKIELYRKNVVSFVELARERSITNPMQKRQIDYTLNDKGDYIDRDHIRGFLTQLSYPLYFLDFESVQPAIPRYENTKPYTQIPFQYSLHFIESEGGALEHKEFLAKAGTDPRSEIAKQLCIDIPSDVCVTAYNKRFECTRLKELAEISPDSKEHLLKIRDNIVDLMVPFQSFWYYNRAMGGSFSIKSVLPALFPGDPELDYNELEGIHNGSEAMNAFPAMEHMSLDEQERTRRQLLEYCKLDTYAMFKVWQKLVEAAG